MKTTQELHLRAFPVLLDDERTGQELEDVIVLSKQQLQAAQLVGESSKNLIERAFNRQGYWVVAIGKARKVTATLDLLGLYEMNAEGGADGV